MCCRPLHTSNFLLSILTICRLRLRLYCSSNLVGALKCRHSLAQQSETSTRICVNHWIGFYFWRLLGFTKVNARSKSRSSDSRKFACSSRIVEQASTDTSTHSLNLRNSKASAGVWILSELTVGNYLCGGVCNTWTNAR